MKTKWTSFETLPPEGRLILTIDSDGDFDIGMMGLDGYYYEAQRYARNTLPVCWTLLPKERPALYHRLKDRV